MSIAIDDPPNSRLFVVAGRNTTAEFLRGVFESYGVVSFVKYLREKGVAYVKYDRASSAALAIENLHEVTLNDGQGPRLKVILADSPHSRTLPSTPGRRNEDDYSTTDPDNLPPRSRLFMVVPKSAVGAAIEAEMAAFGGMQYCKTDLIATKGIVFVKYARSSSACLALESCAAAGTVAGYRVKVMLADPKMRRGSPSGGRSGGATPPPGAGPLDPARSVGLASLPPSQRAAAVAEAARVHSTRGYGVPYGRTGAGAYGGAGPYGRGGSPHHGAGAVPYDPTSPPPLGAYGYAQHTGAAPYRPVSARHELSPASFYDAHAELLAGLGGGFAAYGQQGSRAGYDGPHSDYPSAEASGGYDYSTAEAHGYGEAEAHGYGETEAHGYGAAHGHGYGAGAADPYGGYGGAEAYGGYEYPGEQPPQDRYGSSLTRPQSVSAASLAGSQGGPRAPLAAALSESNLLHQGSGSESSQPFAQQATSGPRGFKQQAAPSGAAAVVHQSPGFSGQASTLGSESDQSAKPAPRASGDSSPADAYGGLRGFLGGLGAGADAAFAGRGSSPAAEATSAGPFPGSRAYGYGGGGYGQAFSGAGAATPYSAGSGSNAGTPYGGGAGPGSPYAAGTPGSAGSYGQGSGSGSPYVIGADTHGASPLAPYGGRGGAFATLGEGLASAYGEGAPSPDQGGAAAAAAAVFSTPRPGETRHRGPGATPNSLSATSSSTTYGHGGQGTGSAARTPARRATSPHAQGSGARRLAVEAPEDAAPDTLTALFTAFPGLERCDVARDPGSGRAVAVAEYAEASAARAARAALHGAELPQGSGRVLRVLGDDPAASLPAGIGPADSRTPTGHDGDPLAAFELASHPRKPSPVGFGSPAADAGSQRVPPSPDAPSGGATPRVASPRAFSRLQGPLGGSGSARARQGSLEAGSATPRSERSDAHSGADELFAGSGLDLAGALGGADPLCAPADPRRPQDRASRLLGGLAADLPSELPIDLSASPPQCGQALVGGQPHPEAAQALPHALLAGWPHRPTRASGSLEGDAAAGSAAAAAAAAALSGAGDPGEPDSPTWPPSHPLAAQGVGQATPGLSLLTLGVASPAAASQSPATSGDDLIASLPPRPRDASLAASLQGLSLTLKDISLGGPSGGKASGRGIEGGPPCPPEGAQGGAGLASDFGEPRADPA